MLASIDACGVRWQVIGLVARDRAALEAYIPHSAHRGVVEQYLHPIRESVIVADYEI